jgi:hypothetical protein
MICAICGRPELNISMGVRKPMKHPPDARAIICSSCIQKLLGSGPDDLKAAYQRAMNAGAPGKAQAIEGFIEEGSREEEYARNGKVTRERLSRMA